MEYCGDFGSSMSQHSWTGQQGDISCPAAFSLARETVSELGAHQVFDERLAHGYNHQMFGRTAQVFDTMSNHAYPPQDHPSYHQLTHTSTYPPPYYHSSPYLPPYYPPYQELFMNSSAVTFAQGAGVSTVPTWHQQRLVQQTGATAAPNFQVQASASAMDCQKVPSVYATYNEDDCLTKSEQKPHHGTETQSICDMLAHIQAKLKTVSENLSQDLKRMKSWESKQPASSQPNPSTQEAINMSDEMPVYDVYEDVTACRSRIHPTVDIIEAEQVEVKEDSGNSRIGPERPTNEKKPDNEGIFLCVNKASYNTFGEEAADFLSPHGPVIHADRSIKLTNEKSSQAAHMLFVQGATVHCTDESSEINIKKPDVLIKKHDITSPYDLNNDKEVPIVFKYQLPLSCTTNTWDPGVLNIIDMMLDKYTLLNQVQFGHRIAELSFLSLTAYIQYTAPNGIKNVLHDTSFILQRAANLSQGNYLCFLYCNSVLKSEYCQMRCLWEFSIKLATRLQWDPGDTVTMHSYTATHPIVIHFSRSKWQPLWMESNISMWWKSSMEQIAYLPWDPGPGIHCAEIIGCSPANLIQQGRNVALEVHFWRSMCNAMHYCQIFQRYTALSSLLYWHQHIKFNGIALWLITFNPP